MSKDYLKIQNLTAIRGATTSSGNSSIEIENSVIELINELISRNSLESSNILSITSFLNLTYQIKYFGYISLKSICLKK